MVTGYANELRSARADKEASAGMDSSHRVLLVAPSPPPYGGMAIQARLLEELLRRDGHSVVFFPSNIPFPEWIRFLDRLRYVRTVVRLVMIWMTLWRKIRQAEVVHVFAASWVYFFAVVCPAVLYGRLQGKQVILNYRGGDARQFFRVYGWAVKPVFTLASVVSAPSQFLATVIRDCFRVPVLIVPNILNGSVFQYRQRIAFQAKMLVTRHLEKIYDVESALKALRKLQERYPEASLWIAGTGSQEEYLRGLVSTWNLKNVRFLGHVSHADLAGIYDQCDILLNASRVDNFPGALLEASGAGLVVVSTCAGGIPFMFENGKSALLVQPGDWEGLARAVESVLQCPSLAPSLVAQASALARECDWKQVRLSVYKAYGFSIDEDQRQPLQ